MKDRFSRRTEGIGREGREIWESLGGRNWAPLNHCFIECFSPRLHSLHENGLGAFRSLEGAQYVVRRRCAIAWLFSARPTCATVLLKKGCQGHKISKLPLRRCTGSHEAAWFANGRAIFGTVRTGACFFFSRVVFPYAPQPRTLREGPAHNSLLAWT